MCSVNDDCDSKNEFTRNPRCQSLNDVPCQKCNSNKAVVLLKNKNAYCEFCFATIATHKFRATLGKSKIVRPDDKILVVYTGDAGSTALLHLIRAGMNETVAKRLVFQTKVVYIDDGAAKGQSTEDRKKRSIEIENKIKSLGFECYGLSLNENSNNDENRKIQSLKDYSRFTNTNDDVTIRKIFDKLSDGTSKMELLTKLRQRSMITAARQLGCNKIFVEDDCTSLAIEVLSNVALGRGSQLLMDVGFVDDRYSDVTILRPMRDFTKLELEFYLRMNNLSTTKNFIPNFTNNHDDDRTIQGLTKKFVEDLDSQFNGTISTIFRTGEKISANDTSKERLKFNDNCIICESSIDRTTLDSSVSALDSAMFSKFVSSQRENVDVDDEKIKEFHNRLVRTNEKIKDDRLFDDEDNRRNLNVENFVKFLCYGCGLIFKNYNAKDLQSCGINEIMRRLSLKDLKKDYVDSTL